MSLDQSSPCILKVGGVKAARISDTVPLIHRLRENGPLSVVLSAPNARNFRTTDTLIEAASALAIGEVEKSRELLLAVQDFVLGTVCEPLRREEIFKSIQTDINTLFQTYLANMEFYARERSPTAKFVTQAPEESNDYTASVRKRAKHGGRGGIGTLVTVIPFIELGENISAIMYAHLTGGISVTSRSWMSEDLETIHSRVRQGCNLIISGALRMNVEQKMLTKFRRGYTDATAGRLAAGIGGHLFVDKEYPVCTADPGIVNGSSQPILEASMATIRSSLHPLVGAQFLNPFVFSQGEPADIQVGNFASGLVTRIQRRDIPEALPLIQIGPVVREDEQGEPFGDQKLGVHPDGSHCLVSVLDHFPRAQERVLQIQSLLPHGSNVGILDNRTSSVLVPIEQSASSLRLLHHKFCEKS